MAKFKNLGQFKNFAQRLASRLTPGNVVGFVGELGAGKTTLIQLIAKELGIKENILSPTFVYTKVYRLDQNSNFVHADAYRLKSASDLQSTGLEEYIRDRKNLVVIEWADRIKKFLPKDTIWVEIKNNFDTREVRVSRS